MKPPTLKQVIDYFIESGSTVYLANAFYDRYQANNWTANRPPTAETNWQVTRRPMRNWKSAVPYFIKRNQPAGKTNRRTV